MPLQSGTRVGGYEVVALLGAGGMGEVYRARDTRLGRDVAIKILSPRIAADRDAIVRFEREARSLAALNHPNIAAIYDVIEIDGQPALILELVEGDPLSDRIAAAPLPIDIATDYARQIADALDTAHEAGIVHRDLKPANVKITDDGRVKVLDFGLAKAVALAAGQLPDADLANSPTVTVHGVSQNVILGTAAYMSPEQARGKRIDKRTDIWAFGCVLFEMLTGKRVFGGETTSDVIAAIIERAPDLTTLPAPTPQHIRRVIERCLEKDPKRRARDIADVRNDLVTPPAADVPVTPKRGLLPIAAAVVIALTIIAVAGLSWRPRSAGDPPASPIEFTFGPPEGYSLTVFRSAVSPDGRHIAFLARNEQTTFVFVRSLETAAVRRLDGTEGVNNTVFWSPDSRAIAFLANDAWKRISIDGGPAVTILPNVVANLGGSWGANDVFLVAPANRTALVRVPISGGATQPVTSLDSSKENSHRWPQWLPDARHFLFTARSDRPESLGIRVGSVDGEAPRTLVNVASQGVYAKPGWLLFVTPDQALMAQRLDPATWTLQGTAQPLAGRVRYNGPSFTGLFDASLDGRVAAYLPAPENSSTLEWFDRTGKPLGRVGPERAYRAVRLSPDGKRIAVELADEHIGTRDLWVVDAATNAITRVTDNPATDWRAVFSADGSSIAFASDRAGASTIFRVGIDDRGEARTVFRSDDGGAFPTDWSRDGKRLMVVLDNAQGRNRGLAEVPLDGGAPVMLVSQETADLVQPRYSPSGDRVAFASRIAGEQGVYVMSIADRRRVRVSTENGLNPVWGPDGRELFYQSGDAAIMRAVLDGVTITSRPTAVFRPCLALNRTFATVDAEVTYDVASDGRFLVNCAPRDAVPSAIHVIVNWQSRLSKDASK